MNSVSTTVRHKLSRAGGTRRDSHEPQAPREEHCVLARSSMLLTQALAAAHSAPDIREERVASIKARLAAGAYEVDSMALAEAIINENPGLFTKF